MKNFKKSLISILVMASFGAGSALQAFELPSVDNLIDPSSAIQTKSSIDLTKITFSGNRQFTDVQIQSLVTPFEKRSISQEELETLRQKVTKLYVDNGYINSGAIIPDQEVSDGSVNIQIIEGKLTNIKFTGNSNLNDDYLYQRLSLGDDEILNVNDIQRRIQVMLDSPLIDKINAQLIPGSKPGEAELLASVKDGKRFEGSVAVDNRISPSVGEIRTSVSGTALSLTGYSDTLTANLGYAEGLSNYSVNYNFPVLSSSTRFEAFYSFADAEIVEKPIADDIEITSRTWTTGFKFILNSKKNVNQQMSLSLGIDRRYSQTCYGGYCTSLTSGIEEDGESNITALRFSQDMLLRNLKQALALRMTISVGVNALGSTQNENEPSSDFFTLLGQSQFAQQVFSRKDQLVIRMDGQLSSTALLPMEQFGVGGRLSVRGYRENQLLRDNGYAGSIEYRIMTPIALDNFKSRRLQSVIFLDTGGAWYDPINRNDREFVSLSSAGLGFRWEPLKNLNTQFYWAYALKSVEKSSDENLQEQGVHFSLQYSL